MKQVPTKNAGDLYTTSDFNEGVNNELKNIVSDSGFGFSAVNAKQLLESMTMLNVSRASYKEDASSTGANYVIDLQDTGKQGLISLPVGSTISVLITNSNTVNAPTISFLNPALGPYTITRIDGASLFIDEIKTGQIIDLYYNGVNFLLKNLNEVISLQDIEEEQLYNVTSVAGNEYTLSRSVGLNPAAYYNGMILKYIATQTNSGAVTAKITDLPAAAVVDSKERVLQPGDFSSGDLIVMMYSTAGNNFKIIKKTEQTRLTSSGIVETRSNNNDYLSLVNSTPYAYYNASPIIIDSSFDKKHIATDAIDFTFNLPDITTVNRNFSVRIEPVGITQDRTYTFNASGGNLIVTPEGTQTPALTIVIAKGQRTIIDITSDTGNVWLISFVSKSSETRAGVALIATQSEVDAGVETAKIVTPATLKNTPFTVNLNVVFPVGTPFFNESPLMISDPDVIVPGWGSLTWSPIVASPGDRLSFMVANPQLPNLIGEHGANDSILGSTNGTVLTQGQLAAHEHFVVSPDSAAEGPGLTASNYVTRNGSYMGMSQDSYMLAGTDMTPAQVGRSSSTGSNQPHSHVLNIRSYVMYCYVRTA